jgi:hypothetical protein
MTAKIQIGWLDQNVPVDVPINPNDILKTNAMINAMKHLSVEWGGRKARSMGWDLVRRIKRIAALLPDDDSIHIHTTNQSTAPSPWDKWDGLGLELRYVKGKYIEWGISIYGNHPGKYHWRYTGDSFMRVASNAGHLIRYIKEQKRLERKEKQNEDAEKYIKSLPTELQPLQRTARATCIRISKDGKSVTECLHDVGGSMTSTEGRNGFIMPVDLSQMQKDHDRIYHRE